MQVLGEEGVGEDRYRLNMGFGYLDLCFEYDLEIQLWE